MPCEMCLGRTARSWFSNQASGELDWNRIGKMGASQLVGGDCQLKKNFGSIHTVAPSATSSQIFSSVAMGSEAMIR